MIARIYKAGEHIESFFNIDSAVRFIGANDNTKCKFSKNLNDGKICITVNDYQIVCTHK